MKQCLKCHGTENLHINSTHKGKASSYMCKKCTTVRCNAWYHSNPENKVKVQMNNMRSYAKRFGYKLIKIKS